MYNFFCCCFKEASPVLPITPSLSQPLCSEYSSYEDIPELSVSSQFKSFASENQDIPGMIEPKSPPNTPECSQRQEISRSEKASKPKQNLEQQSKAQDLTALAPPAYSLDQLKKIHNILLDNVNGPITILLKLQIENYIINPLSLGQYAKALENFCAIYHKNGEQFDKLC